MLKKFLIIFSLLLFYNNSFADYLDYNSYITKTSSKTFNINIPNCLSYNNITSSSLKQDFTKWDLINSTHILNNNLSNPEQLEIWILNLYDNDLNKIDRIKFFCKNGIQYGYQFDNSIYQNGNLFYISNNSIYNYSLINQTNTLVTSDSNKVSIFENLNYYGPINNQHPSGSEYYNYSTYSSGLIYSGYGSFNKFNLFDFSFNQTNKNHILIGPLDYNYSYIIQDLDNKNIIETNNLNLDPSISFSYNLLNIKDWSNPNFIISYKDNNNISYITKNYFCLIDYPTCSNNLCYNSLNITNNKACTNNILDFGNGGLLTTPPSNIPSGTGTSDPYSSINSTITNLFKGGTGSVNINLNQTGSYITKSETGYTIQDLIFSCSSIVEQKDISFLSFLNWGIDFSFKDLGLPEFLTPNFEIHFHPFDPLSCLFKSIIYIKEDVIYINNNSSLKDLIIIDIYNLFNSLTIIKVLLSIFSFLGLFYLIKRV